MNYEGLKPLLESLSKVDLYYWRGKKKPLLHTIPLLLASGVLITFSRAIFFGFDNVLVSTIASLTGFLILCVSCGAALVRSGAKIPEEIYALAHTIATTWLLALTLLVPSLFQSLRWFKPWDVDTAWPIAAVYAAVSTLILLRRSCVIGLPKPTLPMLIASPIFIFAMTTIFLFTIIMDEQTDSFFRESAQSALEAFGTNEPTR